jgi:hypothetical protein
MSVILRIVRWGRPSAVIIALVGVVLGNALPAAAAAVLPDLETQTVAATNQDRQAAGLPALIVDPRLTAVAEARAQYMVANGYFSHCTGGESDASCPQSGDDAAVRDQAAGIDMHAAGTAVAENLAMNTYPAVNGAAGTNTDWLNHAGHRENILDPNVRYTGVAVVCCWAGTVNGTAVQASDGVTLYVQEFSGGPGATPPLTTMGPRQSLVTAAPGACQFVLGFAVLHSLDPADIGPCASAQTFAANGDAQQATAHGLMAWRKADNWTAFTNGYQTWINGPTGLAKRLNGQRFSWEANPDGLPLAP